MAIQWNIRTPLAGEALKVIHRHVWKVVAISWTGVFKQCSCGATVTEEATR